MIVLAMTITHALTKSLMVAELGLGCGVVDQSWDGGSGSSSLVGGGSSHTIHSVYVYCDNITPQILCLFVLNGVPCEARALDVLLLSLVQSLDVFLGMVS